MKAIRTIAAVAFVLAAVLIFGVMTAAAQGPTGSSVTQVAYLDTLSHTLGPNSNQLFRFGYNLKDDGTRPLTTIRLPNGTQSGLAFEIWTLDELNAFMASAGDTTVDKTTIQPVGRGTAQTVNCDTGAIDGSAACLSPDLTWTGTFGSNGTYYVRVINNNNSESKFQLNIQGSGVSLGQQQQTAALPSSPAAAPALVTTGSDPMRALALDTQSHNIAAKTATWYRLDYSLKDDASRPTVTIRVPNGYMNGLAFEIWTLDEFNAFMASAGDTTVDKTTIQPIGRGTAQTVNCDTGAIDGSAACKSADLSWLGTFGSNGTYYVKVINNNAADANYQLLVTQ